MQIRYSKTADVIYIELVSDAIVDRSVEVDSGTIVDLDVQGRVLGIEVLRPSRPWPLAKISQEFRLNDEDLHLIHEVWGADGESATRFPFSEPMPVG